MAQINVKLSDTLKNFIDAQAGKKNLSAPAYIRELVIAEQNRIKAAAEARAIAIQKAKQVARENNPFNKGQQQQQPQSQEAT